MCMWLQNEQLKLALYRFAIAVDLASLSVEEFDTSLGTYVYNNIMSMCLCHVISQLTTTTAIWQFAIITQ